MRMGAPGSGTTKLDIQYDGDSEGVRAEEAADELLQDLKKHSPLSATAPIAATTVGTADKGWLEDVFTIVLNLITSGAVTHVIDALRDWLNRSPQKHSVVIRDGEGNVILRVDIENVDDPSTVEALKLATVLSTR